MNLRTIKKLSKRAAPLLPLLGDTREQFKAERGENYHSTAIRQRKYWERSRTVWKEIEPPREGRFCYRSRKGHVMVVSMPSHPLKGTPMVGATSGYYEPEWDEETAWDALRGYVLAHFMDYGNFEGAPKPTRIFRTPGDVFNAASEIIRERSSQKSTR